MPLLDQQQSLRSLGSQPSLNSHSSMLASHASLASQVEHLHCCLMCSGTSLKPDLWMKGQAVIFGASSYSLAALYTKGLECELAFLLQVSLGGFNSMAPGHSMAPMRHSSLPSLSAANNLQSSLAAMMAGSEPSNPDAHRGTLVTVSSLLPPQPFRCPCFHFPAEMWALQMLFCHQGCTDWKDTGS